jgi:uncharacterized protein (TIGR03437 family)
MSAKWIASTLLAAAALHAQSAPAPSPQLGLDINAQADAVVARGWPLLIRAAVISSDGQPVSIALKSGAWTQALKLIVIDANGAAQNWPLQLLPPANNTLSLSGVANAEAVWLVAPADTANIAVATYTLAVTLDTTATAASGAWNGAISGNGASIQIQVEPGSLTAQQEASKYIALSAYSHLLGDDASAASALDTLLAHQPDLSTAYTMKGDLLAAAGDWSGAVTQYNNALIKFTAANPNAVEPLTAMTQPLAAAAIKLSAQQQAASGGVTNVPPGSSTTVFAPDSIVNAYGSGLATSTAAASGSLSTSLGGTTVTVTDSAGAAAAAQLFYVSPTQVNWAVPPTVALGAATVTVKSGDGSTHTGAVTLVDVQPALITLNSAGLIAAGILRVKPDGTQVNENVYSVDASGAVVAAPIDVTNGQVYLTFYGTGFRRASTGQVTATIGSTTLPVAYSGAQGYFTGLDQVNLQLPASLAGAGDVPLSLMVSGKQSNSARITFK